MYAVVILVLMMVVASEGFQWTSARSSAIISRSTKLQLAEEPEVEVIQPGGASSKKAAGSVDPKKEQLDKIRAKMSQPGYDPMKDPEAVRILNNMVPDVLKSALNSLRRTKATMETEMSATIGVEDLDETSKMFQLKDVLMSSPQSKVFKKYQSQGVPETPSQPDEQRFQELKAKFASQLPPKP